MVKIIEPSFKILTDIEALNPLKMIEIAARTCYQSWDYMQEGSDKKLIKHLVDRGHWAMIEHGGMISVRFIANRGMSHELVRMRLASYAQESTRYVDLMKDKHGAELTIIKPIECPISVKDLNSLLGSFCENMFEDMVFINKSIEEYGEKLTFSWTNWLQAMLDSEKAYLSLRSVGFPPQLARSVLPIGLKTEIVCTANLREWHHIFKLRTASAAHPLIRTLMRGLLKEFKLKIPIIFDDLPNYI